MSYTLEEAVDGILMKIARSEERPPGDIASFLAAGGGIGAAGGAAGGLLQNIPRIKQIIQAEGRLPEQEAWNREIKKQLKDIRKAEPSARKMTDRAVLNDLLGLPKRPKRKVNPALEKMRQQLSPPGYHHISKGYEEGLIGKSRSSKMVKALKSMIRKNVLKKGLLGMGIGLGGGLLGATAVGHFDK